MIDETTKKFAVIIDGKLTCKMNNKFKDLFSDETPAHIAALEKKLEAARDEYHQLQTDHILETLRNEINNFKTVTGQTPTLCLMNYRDVNYICIAYNAETEEIKKNDPDCDRLTLDTYSSYDYRRIIDGVKIKKGCDQEPGQIRFYSAGQ